MKKNTGSQIVGCQLINASTGAAVTSGTTTVYVTGDGGTQAAGSVGSGACTHEGQGYWTYAPAQAETNYDQVAFTFTNASAIPVTVQLYPSFPQTGDSYARIGAPAGASVSADVAAVKTDTAAILVDTGTTLDARIPAALVSGRMDCSVGAMATGVVTATAIAADAIGASELAADAASEIGTAVWATAARTLTANTNFNDPTAATIAAAVWDMDATAHQTGGTFGQAIGDPGADTNTIFKAVVTDATGATVGVDVAAVLVDTTEIGAAGAGLTNINLPDQTMNITGDITGNLSGSVGSVTGAVGSVTGNVGGNVTGSVGSVAAGGITAASIATGAIDADALAADAVDEILDETIGDSTITMRQALKLLVATLGGKLSGAATTTVVIRNAADTTDVVSATVDADGNRSAVTLTL